MPTPENTPLERRTDTELRGLVRGSRPDVAQESLKILGRRGDARLPVVAREAVLRHADPHVRATAAVALATDATAAGQEALATALREQDPLVQRRAAQSLGRTGDLARLTDLDAVRADERTPLGRSVAFARTLISYRHGLDAHLVGRPERLQRSRFTKAREIEIRRSVPGASRPKLADEASRELPGLTFDAAHVHPLRCSGVNGALVLASSMVGLDDPATVLRTPRVVGALLRERVCSERFTVDAYLLTDDRDASAGARVRVWLVRPEGTVLHAGTATVKGSTVTFTVNESQAPYGRPIRFTGSFDSASGDLTVDEAVVAAVARDADLGSTPSGRVRP